MTATISHRPAFAQRRPPKRSFRIMTDEEIQGISQEKIGSLVEQLNIEILRLDEELKTQVQRVRSIRSRLLQLPNIDADSLREMEHESEGIQREVRSLRHYRGNLVRIWRSREGLDQKL